MSDNKIWDSNLNEKEVWGILNEELAIPEVVNEKAYDAFYQIKKESSAYHNTENGGIKIMKVNTHKKNKRKMTMVLLAATLVVGTVTAGAAVYMKWSSGLEKGLRVTEEQKEMAESTGLADFPEISMTQNEVTVTAQQSIVDNYYAYLSFKVEGYECPEGEQPMFSETVITVDGQTVTMGASFYDGLISDANGKAVLADGSPIPLDENGAFLLDYTMEDGSLEYRVNLSGGGESGYFMDKPIHVELKDLGYYADKEESRIEVEGSWIFDWTLSGDESIYVAECNEKLGDTGATVTNAEISPISIKAVLEMPRQEIIEIGYREFQEEINGEWVNRSEPFEFVSYEEPPRLSGVKLVDGTILPNMYMGPGTMGYVDDVSDTYEVRFAIDRILDVDQVESLLFVKAYPEGEEEFTEDNFYVVNIR